MHGTLFNAPVLHYSSVRQMEKILIQSHALGEGVGLSLGVGRGHGPVDRLSLFGRFDLALPGFSVGPRGAGRVSACALSLVPVPLHVASALALVVLPSGVLGHWTRLAGHLLFKGAAGVLALILARAGALTGLSY